MTTAALLQIAVRANTAQANAALATTDARLKKTATTAQATSAKVAASSSAMGAGIARGMKAGLFAIGAVGAGSIVAAAKFEDSFASVRKTVDASEKDFQKLETGLRNMAKEVPIAVTDLNELAGEAGALGIKSKDLLKFTRVAADLGVATDMSANDAANALARLSNIMGTSSKDFKRMGSTLVDLGNKGASTEGEISDMALRVAGAGETVGLTEAQVLGLSAALANLGIRSEAGGSAISRVMLQMQDAIAQGDKTLTSFAKTAGMSEEQFADLFGDDPTKAISAYTKGLGTIVDSGGSVMQTLEGVELSDIRVRDTLLRVASSTKGLTEAQKVANKEWEKNNALTTEAEKKYKTTASQFQVLKNRVFDLGISIGDKLLPKVNELMGILGDPKISIGDKISAVVKTLAEEGAKIGGTLAKAVGQAFLDTSIWGKLFMAGALIRIFGGAGIFGKMLGKMVPGLLRVFANPLAIGIGAAIVGAVKGAMEIKDLSEGIGAAEKVGEEIGNAMAAGVGPKLDKAVDQHSIPALNKLRDKVAKVGAWMEEAGLEGGAAWERLNERLEVSSDKMRATMAKIRESIHRMEVGFHSDLGSITKDTEKNFQQIKATMGTKSQQARDLIDKNFNSAVKAIRTAMDQGRIKTDKGMAAIADIARQRLSAFGITGADAEKIIKAQGAKRGDLSGFQRGGAIFGGNASGDSVPALLERGEYVLNRNAVKTVGKGRLDGLNFGAASRFAEGGIVPAPGFPGEQINSKVIGAFTSLVKRFNLFLTDAYGPGHASSEHTKYGTAIDVIPGPGGSWSDVGRAVAASVKAGYNPVYYDGSFGSINLPPHGPGHHAHITLLTAAELLSGKTAGGTGMVNFKLPRFVGKFIEGKGGAAGLNNAAAALEKILGQRVGAAGGVEGAEFGGGTFNMASLEKLWSAVNPGVGSAHQMAAVAMSESAGDPRAVGHDPGGTTGYGLWQITSGFHDDLIAKYGGPGGIMNPTSNAKAAASIYKNEGIGAWYGAWEQFMQAGGMPPFVGSFKDGGKVGKDGIAKVHKGETITKADKKEWDKLIHQQLVELKKLAEADHRLKKQARGVLREQGASWAMDALGGYIADVGVRSSRYAGNGRLTNIGKGR